MLKQFRDILGLLCLTGAALLGQTLGEITGEVKDPSGASAPNAVVTATNAATNVARTTSTNTSGIYSFPGLIPGVYQVKVVVTGFETMVKTNIELQVQQTARIDFTLSVGQATQTIEVAANGALLTTESATFGTVIEERRIVELPLNGRNFFSLVALSPGVTFGFTPAAQAAGRQGGSRSTLTMSLSGARATWNNYTLDGISNTDVNFNLYVVLPSVDAIQEFKVQSGIYPAEFGRAAGQINVSTKPGTNAYHGTLFEFLRNDAFDARNYDFLNTRPGKAPYRQNQFGYTLGGPVRIPKLFDGRNRLFFMSNYEGFKSRTTRVASATTFTPAMRNGDFSAVPNALNDAQTRIGTSPNVASMPHPGNQIPASRFDKGSLLLLSRFNPLPNVAQPAGLPNNNYQYSAKTPIDKKQVTERIDFNESANSQWFGRYSWTDENTLTPGLTVDGSTLYTRASQWAFSNTRVISASKVNEARFGYNSLFNNNGQQLAGIENVNKLLNIPVEIKDPNSWGIPNIGLTNNLTSFGNPSNGPFAIDNKTFQIIDNFSWIIGKHSLRMGGEYRYNKFNQLGNEFPRGQFQFNGSYSANPNNLSGGYSGADFLTGTFFRADIAVALAQGNFRNHEWAGYVDDTWKVKKNLTMTFGLRWEVFQPMLDTLGNEVNFQLQQPLPGIANEPDRSKHPVYVRSGKGNFYDGLDFRYTGAVNGGSQAGNVQVARDGRLGPRLIDADYNNFAPRLGVAYSPSDKWSIRTGVGVFFSEESKNSIFDNNRGLGGRTGVTPDLTKSPVFNYTNFLNASALPAGIATSLTWGTDNKLRNTYSMNYMLNVQRALGKATTLEVGYNGSLSRKVALITNQNAPLPGITAFASRAPYPEWLGIQYLQGSGVANYNGLTMKLSQRFSSGLTTLFSYTFSKALDDSSAIRGVANDFGPANMRCRSCEYGFSSYNIPHRFVTSILYTLPFGKGKKFLNHGGIVHQIAGGWQLSTITTAQNGAQIDTTGWDSAGTSFVPSSNRINCAVGVNPVVSNPTADRYFNPAAFYNVVAGEFGNCARNHLRGPHTVNIDFSVIKDFRVTEKQAVQFRLEMFNAPNHVQWGNPNANWGNQNAPPAAPATSFGQIRGTATSMRQIQFALKYNF